MIKDHAIAHLHSRMDSRLLSLKSGACSRTQTHILTWESQPKKRNPFLDHLGPNMNRQGLNQYLCNCKPGSEGLAGRRIVFLFISGMAVRYWWVYGMVGLQPKQTMFGFNSTHLSSKMLKFSMQIIPFHGKHKGIFLWHSHLNPFNLTSKSLWIVPTNKKRYTPVN